MVGTHGDAHDVHLVFIGHERADIDGHHPVANVLDGRDRKVHQYASVHVVCAFYFYWREKYGHTAGSRYAFCYRAFMELDGTSVVEVGRRNDERSLKFLQFLGFQVGLQEVDKFQESDID